MHAIAWIGISALVTILMVITTLYYVKNKKTKLDNRPQKKPQPKVGIPRDIDPKRARIIGSLIILLAIIIVIGIAVSARFGPLWLLPFVAFATAAILWKRQGTALLLVLVGVALLIVVGFKPLYASAKSDDTGQQVNPNVPLTPGNKKMAAGKTEIPESSDTDATDPKVDNEAALKEENDMLNKKREGTASTQSASSTGTVKVKNFPAGLNNINNETTTGVIHTLKPVAQNDYIPNSGDEGKLIVRMTGCSYAASDEVDCEGFVENTTLDSLVIYLHDSSGVNSKGMPFSVWTFGNSIAFKSGGNMTKLVPEMKSAWIIKFRQPSDVTCIGLNLELALADANVHEYTFVNIPVSRN